MVSLLSGVSFESLDGSECEPRGDWFLSPSFSDARLRLTPGVVHRKDLLAVTKESRGQSMAYCTSSEGWGWCLRSTFAVAHGLRTIHIIWIYVRTAKNEASQSGEDSVMLCLLFGGIAQ